MWPQSGRLLPSSVYRHFRTSTCVPWIVDEPTSTAKTDDSNFSPSHSLISPSVKATSLRSLIDLPALVARSSGLNGFVPTISNAPIRDTATYAYHFCQRPATGFTNTATIYKHHRIDDIRSHLFGHTVDSQEPSLLHRVLTE
jgi:hypothetical protein